MVKNDQPDDAAVALLEEAWRPDGPSSEEVRMFRSLPLKRREKVVARLKVLLEIEEARREVSSAQIDMKARAKDAGLTVDGLFAIRRKWEERRSIASIAPYLGRAERQPAQRSDDDPVVVAALELIDEMKGKPDSVIASELRKRFGASVPNMIRLVRRLRRESAADPAVVADAFGRALLVDVCAIDRVNADGRLEPIAAAVVVESATTLVLGTAVESVDGDTIAAQRRAVLAAIERLEHDRLDLDGDMSAVELTIGEGPDAERAFRAAHDIRSRIDLRVNSVGPRRFGQRLVSLMGKRLGGLWWRPRSSAPLSIPSGTDGMRAMSLADATFLLSSEMVEHNRPIEANLAEGGVGAGQGVPEGAMVAALRQVLIVLGDQSATAD